MSGKILVTGSNGQLGKALQDFFPNAIFTDSADLDITDSNKLNAFNWSNIEIVINAAAYTNVDDCETNEGRIKAWDVNSKAVGLLSEICAKNSITFVHISSDYVFDGQKKEYSESDKLCPLGVYGQSKAAGDIAAATCPKHYLIRSSWVIGDGKNFVRSIMGLAERNISPSVVADQFGRPTFTTELAAAIKHLLKNNCEYGTYNLSSDGETASWADLAREIYKNLDRDDLTVSDTTAEKYFEGKISSPRPTNSRLNLDKIKSTDFNPSNWKDSLKEYMELGAKK